MKMVSSSRLRCLLLLLLSLTASISCSSAAQRDSKLRLLLHRTPLLGSKQDLSPSSLAQLLLSDLLQEENEALEEQSFPSLPEGAEPDAVHADLERAAVGGGGGAAGPPGEEGRLQELLLEDLHLLLSPPPPPPPTADELFWFF